jgi:hypothetical protein
LHVPQRLALSSWSIVKPITDSLFKVVDQRATALNIYTYEIRSDSKAIKTFCGEPPGFHRRDNQEERASAVLDESES